MTERITDEQLVEWESMLGERPDMLAPTRIIGRLIAEVRRLCAERDAACADRDIMRDTLTRAQARGTELLERARKAEASAKYWQGVAEMQQRALEMPKTHSRRSDDFTIGLSADEATAQLLGVGGSDDE